MLKERQKSILEATISEHLRTARPVASQELAHCFGLKAGPATVRNEMLKLDKLGYLEQPHTSAGRIPTDKGYRFFVDNLLTETNLREMEKKTIRKIFIDLDNKEEFIKELSKIIAYFTGSLAGTGIFGENIFYESGLAEVLREQEFQEAEYIQQFGQLVDNLEENLQEFLTGQNFNLEEIFIGRENPFKEARNCTMIISSWEHPQGFKGFISLVGPKRTDYCKKISLTRYLKTSWQTKLKKKTD